MTNRLTRSFFFAAALALVACGPSPRKCTTNSDCTVGQSCDVMSGLCGPANVGGGTAATGGGSGGGNTGGGSTGGGIGTGGGSTVSNGGDTCAMAVLVTGDVRGETTGSTNNYNPPEDCTGGPNPGVDTVYRVNVPAGQRISVRGGGTTTTPNFYDLSLYLVPSPASNCDAVEADGGSAIACLSGSDDPDAVDAIESATWFNGTGAATEVFVVVDSFFATTNNNPDGGQGIASEGAFALEVEVATPGTNGDRCETAVTLTPGTPLTNQDLANFGNDYQPGANDNCPGKGSNDATYKIDVPAGQVLRVTATPSASLDLTLGLSETAAECGAVCVSGADSGGEGDAEQLLWKNTGAATATVFVVVDGNRVTTGTFELSATVTPPPADDTCDMPTQLTSGVALTGQTLDGYSNDFDSVGTDCGFEGGGDRAYTITVPAGDRLVVTVDVDGATSDLDSVINLVEGAGACGTACLAVADDGFPGDSETLTFVNRSGSAQQYVIVIDAWSGGGEFTLTATVATPAADDVCQGATALTTSLTAQTTANYTGDYGFGEGCATSGYLGPDRVYSVAVPTGVRGVVTVTPTLLADGGANFAPSISLVEGVAANCEVMPRVCQSSTASAFSARSARYYNVGAQPANVYAIVDSSNAAGGTFDIAFTSETPPANDTCTTTTELLDGGPQSGTLVGFESDYGNSPAASNCIAYNGPERLYRVSLPNNQRVSVTVTPFAGDAGIDTVINFIPVAAAVCESTSTRTCAYGADQTVQGLPETATYANTSGATADVFVAVADWRATSPDLTYSLTHTFSAVPAGESCSNAVPLTAGTLAGQTVAGNSSDVYFGAAVTGCINTSGVPDAVYSITLAAGQRLTATATPTDTGAMTGPNLALNLFDAPSCTVATSCAASANVGARGAAETVTFTNSGAAPRALMLQVAGIPGAEYSLNVQLQ